jgi:hypothetical protein
VKRLIATVLILTALFTSAVRLPAAECAVASAPIGKACKMDCCANKSCCFESQKKRHELPQSPLTRDNGSHQQVIAIIAPRLTTEHIQFPDIDTSPHSSAIKVTHSAPRPALLCTFLI